MATGIQSFVADPKIAKIAEAYAKDAVDFAAGSFQTKLDWSDDSIAGVEAILGKLRASMPAPKPPDELIWNFAKGHDHRGREQLSWHPLEDGHPVLAVGPCARAHRRGRREQRVALLHVIERERAGRGSRVPPTQRPPASRASAARSASGHPRQATAGSARACTFGTRSRRAGSAPRARGSGTTRSASTASRCRLTSRGTKGSGVEPSPLERAVSEATLAGKHPALAVLREPWAPARATKRVLTGVGLYLTIEVAAHAPTELLKFLGSE
jgi:hypothetical protein